VREVAASLSADAPYFLEGGTALGLDRGDELFPLMDLAPFWVTLVIPSFGVNTKDAYAWWDEQGERESSAARREGATRPMPEPGRSPTSGVSRKGTGSDEQDVANDLQPVVARRHPEITRIVAALGRLGARHAAMSGSGSAVFGLFNRRPAAERAARALSKNAAGLIGSGPYGKILVTRTIGRSTYRRLVGDSYTGGKTATPPGAPWTRIGR